MKDMNRWKWVLKATEKKIHLHNQANSLLGGRLVETGSNTNVEGYVCCLEESLSGISISHQLLSCWKKKCSGFEKVKRKIDTSLEIVIYAGFRFNQGKYSKTDLEKHSKLTSHYT